MVCIFKNFGNGKILIVPFVVPFLVQQALVVVNHMAIMCNGIAIENETSCKMDRRV